MSTLSGILLFGFIVWFWLDSARARELATAICAEACRQRDVQFLDQTVVVMRIGVRWTHEGIRLRRIFRFDFSEEGVERRSGHVTIIGIRMEEFSLGLPSETDSVIPLRPKSPADSSEKQG